MTPLKQRMKEELVLRGYSERTIEIYLSHLKRLARHFNQRPDQLDDEQLRTYVLHLHLELKLGYSGINQAVSAMRFFYTHVIGRCPDSLHKPLPRTRSVIKRPRVYSPGGPRTDGFSGQENDWQEDDSTAPIRVQPRFPKPQD